MVKLVLVEGVYKTPKLDNFGPGFCPQGPRMGAKIKMRKLLAKRKYTGCAFHLSRLTWLMIWILGSTNESRRAEVGIVYSRSWIYRQKCSLHPNIFDKFKGQGRLKIMSEQNRTNIKISKVEYLRAKYLQCFKQIYFPKLTTHI